MFARTFFSFTSKPPGHVYGLGGFLCALFFYSLAATSHAAPTTTLSFSSIENKKPAAVKNSLKKLTQTLAQKDISLDILSADFNLSKDKPNSDLVVMSLHDLAEKIPALQILRLPFFYSDLTDIHQQMDGKLGKLLQQQAQQKGWVILEWWDEGLQVMTGNRRYDQRINLSGMEFVLLRDDPMAQLQFKSLNAWSRRVYPQSTQQLLHECVVASRSATLDRIWSDRLDRVHLSLSLSQHRYEGWVLLAPLSRWQTFTDARHKKLQTAAQSMRNWQRDESLSLEQAALRKLERHGMKIFQLTARQRKDFAQALPPWKTLLPATLSLAEKKSLLSTAIRSPATAAK